MAEVVKQLKSGRVVMTKEAHPGTTGRFDFVIKVDGKVKYVTTDRGDADKRFDAWVQEVRDGFKDERHFLDELAGKEFGFQDATMAYQAVVDADDTASQAMAEARREVGGIVGQANLSKITFGAPKLADKDNRESFWDISLSGPPELLKKVKEAIY